jgi:hypothetical protein
MSTARAGACGAASSRRREQGIAHAARAGADIASLRRPRRALLCCGCGGCGACWSLSVRRSRTSRASPPLLLRLVRIRARRIRRLEACDEREAARARAIRIGALPPDDPCQSRPLSPISSGLLGRREKMPDHTRIAPVAPYRPVGWFWSLPTQTTAR